MRTPPGAPLDEDGALKLLKLHLPRAAMGLGMPGVVLGIGDDATILERPKTRLCWTIDSSEEDVHFRLDWLTPYELAHKSFHAALSDIAAMGAEPLSALCHVTLSPKVDRALFSAFVRGQAKVAENARCPIVGGNLSFGARLGLVTTVLGRLPSARGRPAFLTRSGAKPGDELWLSGEVGWARLGLTLLERNTQIESARARHALKAFKRPVARIEDGLILRACASACQDVSDGLARDTATLAEASGVQVAIDGALLHRTLSRSFLELCSDLKLDPLETALQGGEDYALLSAGPPAKRPPCAIAIGHIAHGRGAHYTDGGKSHTLSGGFAHRSPRAPQVGLDEAAKRASAWRASDTQNERARAKAPSTMALLLDKKRR